MSSPTAHPRFSQRATQWRLPSRVIELPARPLVMGIVNVTPDSFSDGGRFFSADAAIAQAKALIAARADFLDIGGESTRPYSQPVDEEEELRRVLPVVTAIAGSATVPVSIDTSKPAVARACLAAGAEIINDVTGLADEAMVALAVETGAAVCVMHMQGTPQTMQDHPTYDDVVEDILAYLRGRRDALVAAGIARERIAMDPGIGFGKTHEHNQRLLANCHRFHELGCPLLVGPSRKGFIGKVLGNKEADRTAGTIGVALSLAVQGVQILRVHDVREVRQALMLFEATGGLIPTASER
jgi:dihydropteroate synthase